MDFEALGEARGDLPFGERRGESFGERAAEILGDFVFLALVRWRRAGRCDSGALIGDGRSASMPAIWLKLPSSKLTRRAAEVVVVQDVCDRHDIPDEVTEEAAASACARAAGDGYGRQDSRGR